MPNHDIVVIGASAGGIEALSQLVQKLPRRLPASILIVVHFPTRADSLLPEILSRRGRLPAVHPRDNQPLEQGCIYVAPPNAHLLVQGEMIHLGHGVRENGFRPAIDPLFRSAAQAFGPRVVGILLSGSLDDGVAGLNTIKRHGGVALVQDPSEALFPILPLNAIEQAAVDEVLSISEIAARIEFLANEPVPQEDFPDMADEDKDQANQFIQQDISGFEQGQAGGNIKTVLTCPECGGLIWEIREGGSVHYDCHVGHSYTSETMLLAQANALESALWTAVRTLEERAALVRRLAARAAGRNSPFTASRFSEQAAEAERSANVIRDLLENTVLLGERSGNSPAGYAKPGSLAPGGAGPEQ